MSRAGRDIIFISYAHSQRCWVERLQVFLKPFEGQGLQVWADRYVEGAGQWRREVRDALSRACVGVLMVDPEFLASDFICDEELLPLLEGAGGGELALLCVPLSPTDCQRPALEQCEWAYDPAEPLAGLAKAQRHAALVQISHRIYQAARPCGELASPCAGAPPKDSRAGVPQAGAAVGQRGVLRGVPPQRPHFVVPGTQLARIKERLLCGGDQVVGVLGQAGIGKTTLAIATANDNELRRKFAHGVFWVTLGRTPALPTLQATLLEQITGRRQAVANVAQGRLRLGEALEGRTVLLVVDDVWRGGDAHAFDAVDRQGAMLVTTTDLGVLAALGAAQERLDTLAPEGALDLLAAWSNRSRISPVAAAVADSCERLPLALALAGARAAGGASWEEVLAGLEEARTEFPNHPSSAVLRAMRLSFDALPPNVSQRYRELAVFPNLLPVPESAVLRLWQHSGALEGPAGHALLRNLQDRALLTLSEGERGVQIGLHDLQLDFLRLLTEDAPALHDTLLGAYQGVLRPGDVGGAARWVTLPPGEPYLWRAVAHHLTEARHQQDLWALLFDFRWLRAKLAATDVNSLMADYQGALHHDEADCLHAALSLSAPVLAEDPAQLASQLTGRLLRTTSPKLPGLLVGARQHQVGVWLRPLTASLTPPSSPLVKDFGGHDDWVRAVALTGDGLLAVSGADDGVVKVWDLQKGEVLATLKGHDRAILALAVTADGRRAISASAEGTTKLWDLEWGIVVGEFAAHRNAVSAVALTSDARLAVSGSIDRTLKMWDLERDVELATLSGHDGAVLSLALTADGRRAASGSADHTVKLWDLQAGEVLATLMGHGGGVWGLALTADGRCAVSGSDDGTAKVWDLERRVVTTTLTGHRDWVRAVALTPDGRRAVSGSDDHTVRVWDVDRAECLATFTADGAVVACAIADSGDVIAAGDALGQVHLLRLEGASRRGPVALQ